MSTGGEMRGRNRLKGKRRRGGSFGISGINQNHGVAREIAMRPARDRPALNEDLGGCTGIRMMRGRDGEEEGRRRNWMRRRT